jgi:hypothetical protein
MIGVTRIGDLRSVLRLLVTANIFPSSLILFALKMVELPSNYLLLHEPHSVASQETAFFIVALLKTSNLK